MQNKAELSQLGWGLGIPEAGTKAELGQLGLGLWLILSLEDFPGGLGGWSRTENIAQLSWGLSLAIKFCTKEDNIY